MAGRHPTRSHGGRRATARAVGALALAALVVRLLPPGAVRAGQDTPQVFRAEVTLVRLDVSVLDQDRNPIRDLTAGDFRILIDGVLQPIVAFSPVVIPPPEVPTAPWMRDVAPDVRTNLLGEPRLFVIIMDDAVMPADPFMIQTGKAIARAVVDQLGPGDLAAVLFTMSRSQSQDLTSDRAKLLEAIDRFSFGFAGHFPGMDPTRVRYSVGPGAVYSKRTLQDTIALLQGHPQTRNTIILISDEVPDPSKGMPETEEGGLAPWEAGALARSTRVGRLPIYFFSCRGLEAPGLTRQGQFEWNDQKLRGNSIETLADASGGRAIRLTNAPADQVPAVFDEMSVYYLIGYRPTYPLDDGRARQLRIDVSREGANVSPGGRTIWSPKPAKRTSRPSPSPSPLLGAMADLLPQSDIPLQVSAVPFAIPRTRGGATAALAVNLRVRQPAPAEPLVERVKVLGNVFTPNGKVVTSVRQDATIRLVPAGQDSEYELLSRVDLKPGRYVVRYSVQSQSLGRTGSVYTDLVVPDFRKAPLALSGLVLSAVPAVKAAPRDALAAILPVVPTTARTFVRSDQVTAFTRVYQGGTRAPQVVEVEATLTDGRGARQRIRADQLAPAQFRARREADYSVDLSLAALAPGPYLLSIHARTGAHSAQRQIRFVVQ